MLYMKIHMELVKIVTEFLSPMDLEDHVGLRLNWEQLVYDEVIGDDPEYY